MRVLTIDKSPISRPVSFIGETVKDILAELVKFAECWDRDWVDVPNPTIEAVEEYAARVFDVPTTIITQLQLDRLPWERFADDWGCVDCFATEINGCELELKHDPDRGISYLWFNTAEYSYNEPEFFDHLLGNTWQQYVLGHEIQATAKKEELI